VTAPEEKFQQLKTTVRDLDAVLECHHVTGADSLVLKVVAVSVAHLERVIEALGRHGTPTTGIILSSPVPRRAIHGLPASGGEPPGRRREVSSREARARRR
jgi:Lrp/AsnC family leucine-responsive transcriptional regulator